MRKTLLGCLRPYTRTLRCAACAPFSGKSSWTGKQSETCTGKYIITTKSKQASKQASTSKRKPLMETCFWIHLTKVTCILSYIGIMRFIVKVNYKILFRPKSLPFILIQMTEICKLIKSKLSVLVACRIVVHNKMNIPLKIRHLMF